MSCLSRNKHKLIASYHRVHCPCCGVAAARETCPKAGTQLPEPAGWRALMCGFFTHRPTTDAKRLWDELRYSAAYQPWGDELMTQPHPPRWFKDQWLEGLEPDDGRPSGLLCDAAPSIIERKPMVESVAAG